MKYLKTTKEISITPLYEATFEARIHLVEVVSKNHILINFVDSPNITLLNKKLKILENKDLEANRAHVCMSKNGKYIGVSKKDKIEIYNSDWQIIYQIPNIPLYSSNSTKCLFTNDNWYAVYVINTDNWEYAILQVLELETLKVEYEGQIPLEDDYCYYWLYQTPIQNKILIECSAGQNGTVIYLLELNGAKSKIIIWDNDCNRIFGSFNERGNELLTLPHSGGDVIVYQFPSFEEAGRISEENVFASKNLQNGDIEEDWFDFYGRFLNDQRFVFKSAKGSFILVDRERMEVSAELVPLNYDSTNSAKYEGSFEVLDENRLLSYHGDRKLVVYGVVL